MGLLGVFYGVFRGHKGAFWGIFGSVERGFLRVLWVYICVLL